MNTDALKQIAETEAELGPRGQIPVPPGTYLMRGSAKDSEVKVTDGKPVLRLRVEVEDGGPLGVDLAPFYGRTVSLGQMAWFAAENPKPKDGKAPKPYEERLKFTRQITLRGLNDIARLLATNPAPNPDLVSEVMGEIAALRASDDPDEVTAIFTALKDILDGEQLVAKITTSEGTKDGETVKYSNAAAYFKKDAGDKQWAAAILAANIVSDEALASI